MDMEVVEKPICAEFSGPVVRVTLNRPKKRNPLDRTTVRQLAGIVDRVEKDPEARIVLISGAGGHFSAGGDMNGYVDLYRKPNDFEEFLVDFHGLLNTMEASSKIYVAAIEGFCVAGGLELLLACDVVLATRSARIGDGHITFGQLPGAGGSQRLTRVLGPMRAKWLMLTGKMLSGEECEQIGLVSKCVPDGELIAQTQALLDRLLAASPLGLSGMKHLANQGLQMELADALRMELKFVLNYATTSKDASEGLVAFQEKRKPRFTGT
jgi:enoyl-CoA hydratase/carnithine racemase